MSTSGFYDWSARKDAEPTAAKVAEAELVALMRKIHARSDGAFGVPRMLIALRKAGRAVNIKRVARLMRCHGMAGRYAPRKCRTTFPGPDGFLIPGLVARRFMPGAPDVAWFRTLRTSPRGRAGCSWLRSWTWAAAVCLATRWPTTCAPVLSSTPSPWPSMPGADQVGGVIAHADRGSQYTSNDYLDFCQARQMRPSVGQTGICWDNAVAESFWSTLKRECIKGKVYATRAEARRAIFTWTTWYNTERIHTTLNGSAPLEWEQQYLQAS